MPMGADMDVLRVEIAKLTLKPGDKLVVRVPAEMAEDNVEALRRYLYTFLGPDIHGLILHGDEITLSVLEPAEKLFG